MGDFSNIKIPGKYAARVGQSLATSRHILDLAPKDIKYDADDITVETSYLENGIIRKRLYNFSDGIGKISKNFADFICQITKQQSSAFQFRLGGHKGVLAIDDTLEGNCIVLRKSQNKFLSDKTGFDLLDQSEFRHGHLNRQLILLLSSLGIDDIVFHELLDEALIYLDNKSKDYLRRINPKSDAIKLLDKVLDHHYEPIVVEMRNLLKSNTLQELKSKQRI